MGICLFSFTHQKVHRKLKLTAELTDIAKERTMNLMLYKRLCA